MSEKNPGQGPSNDTTVAGLLAVGKETREIYLSKIKERDGEIITYKKIIAELEDKNTELSQNLDIFKSSNELKGITSEGKDKYIISLQEKVTELTTLNKELTINSDKLIKLNKKYEERIEHFKNTIMDHELLANFKIEYDLSKKLYKNYEKTEIRDKIDKVLDSINKKDEFSKNIKEFIESLSNKIIEVKVDNNFEGSDYLNKIKDNKDLINNIVQYLNDYYLDKTKDDEVNTLEIIIKLILESTNPDKTFKFLEGEDIQKKELTGKINTAGITGHFGDKTSDELQQILDKNTSDLEKLRDESKNSGLTPKQLEELGETKLLEDYKSKLDEFKNANEKEKKISQEIGNLLQICDNKYKLAKDVPFFYNYTEGEEVIPDIKKIQDIISLYPTIISFIPQPLIATLPGRNRPSNVGTRAIIHIKMYASEFLKDIFKNKIINDFKKYEENFGNILFELGQEYDINTNESIQNIIKIPDDLQDGTNIIKKLKFNFIESKYLEFIKTGYPQHDKFIFTIEYPVKGTIQYQLFSPTDYDKIISKINETTAIRIKEIHYLDGTISVLNKDKSIFLKEWKKYLKKYINGETSKITKVILDIDRDAAAVESSILSASIQGTKQALASALAPIISGHRKTKELKDKLPSLRESIINKLMLKSDPLIEKFRQEDKKFFKGNCDKLRLYRETNCLLGKCIDYQRAHIDKITVNPELRDKKKCILSTIKLRELLKLIDGYYERTTIVKPEDSDEFENQVYMARYSNLLSILEGLLKELISKLKTDSESSVTNDIPNYLKIDGAIKIYDCLFELECDDETLDPSINKIYGSNDPAELNKINFIDKHLEDLFDEIRKLKDKLLVKKEEIIKGIPDFKTKLLQKQSTEDYLSIKLKYEQHNSQVESQLRELNIKKKKLKEKKQGKEKYLIKKTLALKINPITSEILNEKFNVDMQSLGELEFELSMILDEIRDLEFNQSSYHFLPGDIKKTSGYSDTTLINENKRLKTEIERLEGLECNRGSTNSSGGGKARTIQRRKVRNKRTKRKV
jgi:hypothetical protein